MCSSLTTSSAPTLCMSARVCVCVCVCVRVCVRFTLVPAVVMEVCLAALHFSGLRGELDANPASPVSPVSPLSPLSPVSSPASTGAFARAAPSHPSTRMVLLEGSQHLIGCNLT